MSRKVAFTGVFTGIAVVLVYIGSIMPTGKLTLYFLASLPVALSVVEFGAGAGAAVYFAACILSGLVLGGIYGIIPFALFFGHYPIWKFFIEKGRRAVAEVLLKLAVFNVSGLLWYLLFRGLFMEMMPKGLAINGIFIFVILAALQVIFFIYDYILSRVLYYYETRLSIVKRNNQG